MTEYVQSIDNEIDGVSSPGEEEIQDLHTSKPLQKRKHHFKSGHVKNLKD